MATAKSPPTKCPKWAADKEARVAKAVVRQRPLGRRADKALVAAKAARRWAAVLADPGGVADADLEEVVVVAADEAASHSPTRRNLEAAAHREKLSRRFSFLERKPLERKALVAPIIQRSCWP